MRSPVVFATAIFVAASYATPSAALILNNEDDESHVVTVDIGAVRTTVGIGPGEMRIDLCDNHCTLTLENGLSSCFDQDSIILIDDGNFVVTQ